MARSFTLNLNLKSVLDSKGFRDLESAASSVSTRAGRSLNGVSQTLTRLGPQAERLGKSLSLRVSAPLAAIGALSVKTFADFEDGFKGVQTLLDSSSFGSTPLNEGLDSLQEGLARLNANQGLGLDKLNKALFDTISSGVDAGEAISALEAAGRLAVAGLTDVSVATDGITSALNAFGISADEADSVAAKFFNAQKAGKTTVEELASGFGLVASNAASAGVSLDELLGATSAITLGGVRTNAAFTGLKAAIAGITKPTADAAKEAARLGVQFDSTALRTQGLEGFIDSLVNNPSFGPDSIARLFGSTEAQASINALISKVDEFKGATATIGDDVSGVETLGNAFNTQSESLGQVLARLNGRFENFRVTVGEQIAPIVARFADVLGGLFDRIEASPALARLVAVVGALGAALGPVLIVFSQLTPLISGVFSQAGRVATVFGRLTASSGSLSGSLGAIQTAFRGIIRFVGLSTAAFATLVGAFARVEGETGAFTTIISALFEVFSNLVSSVLEGTGAFSALSVIINTVQNAFSVFFGLVVNGFAAVLLGVTKLVRGLGSIKVFGKSLISDETIRSLDEADEKLTGLISKTSEQIAVDIGISDPPPAEVEVKAVEDEASTQAARDSIEGELNKDLNPQVKPQVDEAAVAELRNRLAQIRLENQQATGDVDIALVARVAQDQFAEELQKARQLGLDTAPIEQKIALTVEAAQFEELNTDIEGLTQRFDQARQRADDLKDSAGSIAAFEFRAEFAADNSEDTAAALTRLREFRENVQNQATANQVDKLILKLEAEQSDPALFALLAQVQRINEDLEQDENRLKLNLDGEGLQQQLTAARVGARNEIDNLVAQASAANPQLDVSEFNQQADQLIQGYSRIAEAREATIGEQVSQQLNRNLLGTLNSITEGTKTVGEAFEDLARGIIKSLTQQALTRSIASIVGALGGAASGGTGGGIFGARTGGLASLNGFSIPAFASGGAIQGFPNGRLNGPGTGTSDSILARVSNGEFVTNRQTTDFFGADFFSRLQDFARRGVNPFEDASFATGGLVKAFNSASSNLNRLSTVPRYQDGGRIERSDPGFEAPSVNIEIKNEGTGKQVSGVERDEVTGQITSIILRDVQENGAIAQNFQTAFGLNRQGQN